PVYGERAVGGVVYACPSSSEMGLAPDGLLTLRAPVGGRPQRIDHLFATASFARPGLVIAVVLSGTGNDGTAGSLIVRLNGGMVIAESDSTAQHAAMPRAAVEAGVVDVTLPAEAIAAFATNLAEGELEATSRAMSRDVAEIARTLAASSGVDFTRYRAATLRRRIDRRRILAGLANVREYHEVVLRDAEEREALARSLLLPVTEFFRDPWAWDALKADVLPTLVARAKAGRTVRVWSAGCASGEEAYSMAIALEGGGAPLERVEILGTDLDGASIRLAQEGVYGAAHMVNVTAFERARDFTPEGASFRVSDALRRAVTFRLHDITRGPPDEGSFDLICCRNVLIYFEDPLQEAVLRTFGSCLEPGGMLFLDPASAVPSRVPAFEPFLRPARIYRRVASDGPPPAELAPRAAPPPPAAASAAATGAATGVVDAVSIEESDALLLMVDASWQITIANRRAREATSPDVAGRRLLDVFPRWRGSAIDDALHAAMDAGRSLLVQGVPIRNGFFDLAVEPFRGSPDPSLLLIAHPTRKLAGVGSPPTIEAHGLHDDLISANAGLQSSNEDLAATNEELAAANEELAAANEELQATNEELATLNEEFLSTNQALADSSANAAATAERARPAVDLLSSILLTRGDTVVACDADRNVTSVTPRAAQVFGLDADAIGRPIDASMLGVEPTTLDAWLRASASARAPTRHPMPAPFAALHVTIESLVGPAGLACGWILAWSPRADAMPPDATRAGDA
ncbi:MAG: CheR family methyltransferase, partial [Thermoplasmatota archaeon]